MSDETDRTVRATVLAAQTGSESDSKRLFEVTYNELRALARGLFRRERARHTLQPTALVHEAYLRLLGGEGLTPRSRTHFVCVAARALRRVLIDYGIADKAQKRGGNERPFTLFEGDIAISDTALDLIDLSLALEDLATVDSRYSEVVTLRCYGGLTVEEVAAELEMSPATVARAWAAAKSWLHERLS